MPPLIDLPADDTCLLYLIRHGATPHNEMSPPRLQGSAINESLSDLGRRQAARVAEHLASRPITGVFCSPMKRAFETASAIAGPHGLDAQPLDSLIEVNVGRWEGKTWPEIQADEPAQYARFMADPTDHGYPGGESIGELIARVSTTLEELMRERLGQEIAVVAHSVVNRTYVGSRMGMPPRKGYDVPQQNCAVNLIRYRGGKAKVVTVNAVGHLL